ncbi:hypothetical protein SLEP1_g39313 [Rubroshorea leprosula]|uniref:Uncharacterized protein n=1 Tax=Rubroshorea leprosula TaxID=152421 RepID=A0AAV5L0K9_9ROSI|nr:hypothetical protein SLEP1_g39313 [Rubroshorea leprosula]
MARSIVEEVKIIHRTYLPTFCLDIGVMIFKNSIKKEVDSPLVAADGEALAGYVLPDAHALGQGVALDSETVRAVDGLSHRLGACGGADWGRHGCWNAWVISLGK